MFCFLFSALGIHAAASPSTHADTAHDTEKLVLATKSDCTIVSTPNSSHSAITEILAKAEPPGISALFFIIIAIFIGAATRHFLKTLPIPFTALLLIFGIAMGLSSRFGFLENWGGIDVHFFGEAIRWAAHIEPHMLLFVFLPILIFEAAFSMDLHTFKKTASNSIILAVPGILVALLLSGILVYGIDYFNLGLEGWANWSLVFMFGAVISATDPVAVVALLKDLGASKKLSTLIEGESLLNDGTGIVLFMVFFLGISGQSNNENGFIEFIRVSAGGLGIGLGIGWVVLKWIKGVFNDALVEISLVVAAAYFSFFLAEHIFHVSGVLALVALGLLVGGIGRSSISPQVEHFMHSFWELAGFIANCLIFLIVGIVIAQRTHFSANDFFMLAIVYVGIHAIRALVILIFYPFMKKTGYGLSVKDAIVVWYGALRGAIGLALALIVVGIDSDVMAKTLNVSPVQAGLIKDQFLFLIAGTVTLTLLINATTMKALVVKLGFLKLSAAKGLMLKTSSDYLKTSTENFLRTSKTNRNLRKANWSVVTDYLPKPLKIVADFNEENIKIEQIAEQRRRILEKEKSSYWKQFKDGMLSAEAVRILTETVNAILDNAGNISLSDRKDLETLWQPPKWLSIAPNWPIIGKLTEGLFFNRLAISYDCAAAFVSAQEECLKLLQSMHRANESDQESLEQIEQEINENMISGQTFVRNLGKNYPEIYQAIATRQAIRTMLNYELHTVERLQHKGQLNDSEAQKLIASVEVRMKQLLEKPPKISLPETREIIDDLSIFNKLSEEEKVELLASCQTKIYARKQNLLKSGQGNKGIFFIARGKVLITNGPNTIDIASKGQIIGIESLLMKRNSEYAAMAETPVTAVYLSNKQAFDLIQSNKNFESLLWKSYAVKIGSLLMLGAKNYGLESRKKWERLISKGQLLHLKSGEQMYTDEHFKYIMLKGKGFFDLGEKKYVENGCLIDTTTIRFSEDSVVWKFNESD